MYYFHPYVNVIVLRAKGEEVGPKTTDIYLEITPQYAVS